jgi:putative nucleotidyltransferase with HDIG domain
MPKKRRRKLDQYVRGVREDPELVLQEMTQLSNRVFRQVVGILFTTALIFLVLWPLDGTAGWPAAMGVALVLFLSNTLGWLAILRIQPRVFDRPASFNQLIFLISLTVALSWFVFKMGWSPFLAPVPMLAMVLAMTFGQPVAFFLAASVAFYLGLMNPRPVSLVMASNIDIVLGVALAMGGTVAVLGMSRVRQQSRPFMVGAYAGLVQGTVVLAFQLIGGQGPSIFNLRDFDSLVKVGKFLEAPGWAIVGGLVSGAAVTCFLPALERFFGVVTERRLLALTDPNHELLQALRNRAPGTHTHTLRVADLASAAAEAIGADPLLARVGAYYHDIGKIAKPEYFVENRESGQSIHDRLRPSMSKLIIISHVKEGVELAEESKLPQQIIDMIPMHHGTTVVGYFFHKAKTEGDPSEPEVEYRYPGPKPRFREAAILMLADGVEAAAKSIAEPNPNRFRAMVHDLALKRLLDHQLDESDLTMRDLARIEDSFVRTLTAMYHGRIKYPEGDAGTQPGQSGRRPAPAPGSPESPPALVAPPLSGKTEPPRAKEEPASPAPGPEVDESPDRHLQPAEVSSAQSIPAQKEPVQNPSRRWPRGDPQRGPGR